MVRQGYGKRYTGVIVAYAFGVVAALFVTTDVHCWLIYNQLIH